MANRIQKGRECSLILRFAITPAMHTVIEMHDAKPYLFQLSSAENSDAACEDRRPMWMRPSSRRSQCRCRTSAARNRTCWRRACVSRSAYHDSGNRSQRSKCASLSESARSLFSFALAIAFAAADGPAPTAPLPVPPLHETRARSRTPPPPPALPTRETAENTGATPASRSSPEPPTALEARGKILQGAMGDN
jgi:hypothetical protein